MKKNLLILSLSVIVLAGFASVIGIIPGEGEERTVYSLRGEEVKLYGRGIYARDSYSLAVQALAQDWVTLIMGIPLMIVSLVLSSRGNYRGRLLHTGVAGYFLYTYMSYVFLVNYNRLFLLYTALFALSLYLFIYSFLSLDTGNIKSRIRDSFPRKSAAGFFIFIALMLLLMWMGRIYPSLVEDVPPYGLEIYTTLVIQAMDLALIIPAALLAAVQLLRRKPLGYALSSIIMLKGITLFTAVSVMGILMKVSGVETNPAEFIIFPAATLINFAFCFMVLRSVKVD